MKKIIIIFTSILLSLVIGFLVFYFLILSSDNSLKSITIEEYSLNFDANTYEYNIDVSNSTKNLNIKVETNDENATYEIIKDNELKEGNNIIKIIVTSQNNKKQEYLLNVYRKTIEYICEDSYELINGNCTRESFVEDATLNYYCTGNQELKNNKCQNIVTTKPTIEYYCTSDYQLNGTSCIKKVETPATKNITCPSTYRNVNGQCIREISYPLSTKYSCPNLYTKYGTTCVYEFTVSAQPVNGRYICTDSSCTLYGSYCECRKTLAASAVRYCSKGTYINGECIDRSVEEPLNTYYKCPVGYELSGTKCVKDMKVTASSKLICPAGYSMNNSICRKVVSTVDAEKRYTCKDGLNIHSDNKCYKTETIDPIIIEK